MSSTRETQWQTQFNEQGYIVVPDVLGASELAHFRSVIDTLIERSRAVAHSDAVFDLEPDHSATRPRVRRIKAAHRVDPVFADFMQHPRVTEILGTLLGPDVRHQYVKLNTKAADGGAPLEWHQDWAFYPHTNDSVLALALMIDDVDIDNGPTLVIPGSHRPRRVFDHHRDGVFVGAMDPRRAEIDFTRAVPITGSAGSVYVFDAFLVHGAARNNSARVRRNCFYEFMAADAWPLEGIHGDDLKAVLGPIESRRVLGEAMVAPRLAEVPVRLPLPRPSGGHYGSIYEVQESLPARYFS